MMTRRSMIRGSLATGSLLSATLSSCGQPAASAPLRVGLFEWPGYAPFYLAQELGFYGDATSRTPVELVNFIDTTDILRAYRQGQIDVICTTLTEVMQLIATLPEQRLVMVVDQSAGADVILAKPRIKSFADLKGKRIGSDLSILASYMLVSALKTVDLTLKDVEIVSTSMSGQVQAYQTDRVDAVITFDPVRAELIRIGAKSVFDSAQIPGEIVDVMAVSQTTLTQHNATLQMITQGFFKAVDYLHENPQDAIIRMSKRERMTPDEFAATLKLLPLANYPLNQQMLDQTNSPLLKVAEQLNQMMIDKKIIEKPVDIKSFLTQAALAKT
jgi:NitT/TauT family transport system substrate-binding protein